MLLLRIPNAVKCFPFTVDVEHTPKVSCNAVVDFKFEAAFAPIQNSLGSGQDVFHPASDFHTKKSCAVDIVKRKILNVRDQSSAPVIKPHASWLITISPIANRY
jgi:hypothetical protein